MPRKTKNKRKTRGGSIMNWIKKAQGMVRGYTGLSGALSTGYDAFGKKMVDSKFGQYAPLINKAVALGLAQLKQNGHGLVRTGNGIRRYGNGVRRTGMGSRLKY
jgi:hypothetical protein